MQYFKKRVYTIVVTLILFPAPTWASATGGESFGGSLQLVKIANQIIDFLQGPIAMILITLGLIVGGAGIMFGRESDKRGFKRIGWVVVGGSIIVGATSLVSYFFGGAVI